jgi:hypothetical protein
MAEAWAELVCMELLAEAEAVWLELVLVEAEQEAGEQLIMLEPQVEMELAAVAEETLQLAVLQVKEETA